MRIEPQERELLRRITRRRFVIGLGSAAAAAAFLAACGDEDQPAATASGATSAAAFPRSVVHKHGTANIPAEPQRVVTVGFTDQDYALAFGVVPIAIREWFGDKPSATWPWAQSLLGGATPVVLPREELDFELIAGMKPDLILGIYSGMTADEYATLSRIAPTIAGPAGLDDYAVSWQVQTRMTGDALGQTERAEELVADLEEGVAAAAAAHPEFDGATFTMVSAYSPSEYYLYGPEATTALFLQSMGLRMPDAVLDATTPENSLVLSPERVDLVDADVIIFYEDIDSGGAVSVLKNDLYLSLPAHREGRDIFLGFDLYAGAFSFASILSLQLLLDDLVPAMARALDGDPATEVALGS
ncbi:MAG: iron-siderophore ABC transporter substrate-binding protein [Dehalococcoidia bacterium]